MLQVQDIFEEAKIIAWKWFRTRSKGFVHSVGCWMMSPLACLGDQTRLCSAYNIIFVSGAKKVCMQ